MDKKELVLKTDGEFELFYIPSSDYIYVKVIGQEKIIDNENVPIEGKAIGTLSDGYHTFDELYEFKKMYNAVLFNEWANNETWIGRIAPKYNVHKSWKHNDGEPCFGGGWFIVSAMLPTGLISNHYKAEDWDLFQVPEVEKALYEFDGHTPQDVLARLVYLNKDILNKEGIKKAMKDVPFIFGTGGEIQTFDECHTWDNIFNNDKFFKQMENKQLTEGQKRVRLTFNPNDLKRVHEFKSIMASAIDEIAEAERIIKNDDKDRPELGDFLREAATAKAELQKASMCGVLALTHQVAFDTLESVKVVPDYLEKFLPHQRRVVEEQTELNAKCINLKVFIDSNSIFKALPDVEQDALKNQLKAMEIYNEILKDRISRF